MATVKIGDTIEFNTCCNSDRKTFKGIVKYKQQLGLIAVVDDAQYEIKKLVNITVISKTLEQVKREKQITIDSLFENLGVFFAFSNQQFEEGKTPLAEGDKYVTFANGSYLPKSNYAILIEGFNNADDLFRKRIKDNALEEDEVLYELNNHECFYTGDIDDAMDVLGEDYSREYVREVYLKHRDRYNDDCGYAIN